ncbi:hypothetical protein [Paraflavitalea speifideaquila]|uniref:hypothetical protein n=1 Tax=Paraflavitalea speifideaquila TaxID=3076558 RepID=UPI0028EB9FB2|nr:hypothetical protein [Paraflavitalea speifideiaquila]
MSKIHFLVHELYNLSNLELKESIAGHEGIARIALPILFQRDPVMAVHTLLDKAQGYRKITTLVKLRGAT